MAFGLFGKRVPKAAAPAAEPNDSVVVPVAAAVALAGIEGSRFNSFAFWRAVEAKVAAKAAIILPQSQKVMTNVIEPAKPADKIEAAQ